MSEPKYLLEDALQDKYAKLQVDIGNRFASMMEGYGHMVSILGTVEDFCKDCKRTVKRFVPSVTQETQQTALNDVASMEQGAMMLAHAAVAMAALARLYRDTVVDIAGGDLLDMLDQDDG